MLPFAADAATQSLVEAADFELEAVGIYAVMMVAAIDLDRVCQPRHHGGAQRAMQEIPLGSRNIVDYGFERWVEPLTLFVNHVDHGIELRQN